MVSLFREVEKREGYRMNKYHVPVTWTVEAHIEVEAESAEEATQIASSTSLDHFKDPEGLLHTLDVHEDYVMEI